MNYVKMVKHNLDELYVNFLSGETRYDVGLLELMMVCCIDLVKDKLTDKQYQRVQTRKNELIIMATVKKQSIAN